MDNVYIDDSEELPPSKYIREKIQMHVRLPGLMRLHHRIEFFPHVKLRSLNDRLYYDRMLIRAVEIDFVRSDWPDLTRRSLDPRRIENNVW